MSHHIPAVSQPTRRRPPAIISLLFIGLMLITVQAGASEQQVTLQLKWKHAFQFAGYYAAQEKGFYKAAGLDVEIREHSGKRSPVEVMLAGDANYAVTGSEVVIHRGKKEPVVALGAIFQHSPYAFLVRADSGISEVRDFAGKRIMFGSGIQDAVLRAALRRHGIYRGDYTELSTSFNISALIDGETDVFSAYTTDQILNLEEAGIEGHHILPKESGIDFYGDILVTTEAEIASHPQRTRRFRTASLKGWEYALKHPNEIIDLIFRKYNTQKFSRPHLIYEAGTSRELIQPLLVDIGYINPARLIHIRDVFADLGFISPDADMAGLIYDAADTSQAPFQWLIKYWIPFVLGLVLFFISSLLLIILHMRRLNRQGTAELAESERHLKKAQSYARIGYWELNKDGRIATLSDQIYQIIGRERSDPSDQISLQSIVHQDDYPAVKASLLYCLATGSEHHITYRVCHPDGSLLWVEGRGYPILGADGKPERLSGFIQDITERKTADEMLSLAATAFETHEGILITDCKGTILRVNKAFTRITGYSAAEAEGNNPRLLQSGQQPPDFFQKMWHSLVNTGRWEGEILNKRKNGEIYPEWETITAVYDDTNQVSHYVGVFFDLTEIKQQREEIERAVAEEQTLGRLLRLSLEPVSIDEFIEGSLEMLHTSDTWLKLIPGSGLFLSEDSGDKEILRLIASREMSAESAITCTRVPYGTCLCGRAAQGQKLIFCSSLDQRHDIHLPEETVHGHYCVPLVSVGKTLGVLLLYPPIDHVNTEQHIKFLGRIVDVLIAGIVRHRAESEIEYQAFHDALTGLPNRRLFIDRLAHDLAVNRRHHTFGALLFLDLDHFKKVNDALGHSIGDALLEQVGKRMKSVVRAEDTLARMGGDEFVVLLSQLSSSEDQASYEAHLVAEKLSETIAKPCYIDGREHQITPSIGIVLFPFDAESPEEILRFADSAMYRAKDAGRNAIRYFMPDMQHAADHRLKLENDLRHAVERNELRLFLQPQVDNSGKLIGAETLLRWFHSKEGLVSPAEFIPIAEESGLIVSIGEWVLREACRMISSWQDDPHQCSLQYLAVNVSPRQFHQPDFIHKLEAILRETGANPNHLELELTEGMLLVNFDETISRMKLLRELGISFSIDDFGTGYSSLIYLKRLPLNKLKIDQSFIRDLETDSSDAAIVNTIIAMAKHLNLDVIAEGVETHEQFKQLDSMGCEFYQGYHFGHPMPFDDFLPLCLKNQRRKTINNKVVPIAPG